MSNKHTKWCKVCGMPVDMRKKESRHLSKAMCKTIKNPEYHYTCSDKCFNKLYAGVTNKFHQRL